MMEICCDGSAFAFLETFRNCWLGRSLFIHLKSNPVCLISTKTCSLCPQTALEVILSLSCSSQLPPQPWTSASFPKRRARAPNLSSSGTTTPPQRAAHVSGTEAAAGTRTASTRMSSARGLVGNQVRVWLNVTVFVLVAQWVTRV